MISLLKPSTAQVNNFLKKSKSGLFSYNELGQSKEMDIIKGYDNDFNRIQVGKGEAAFQMACEAIRKWQMFPGGWAYIEPANAPIAKGHNVAMVARVMGIYFISDCRIVYIVDEQEPVRRYGFAYGTLGRHVEKGEELFSIEMLPDGSVWYVLRAFSTPRFWLARLAYPLARMYQRKFVRESQEAMVRVVKDRN